MQEEVKVPEGEKPDRDKLIYPMQQTANGIMQSFFSTYLNSLMTMIYVFPIAVAGVVEALSQLTAWIAEPLSGAVMDRFSFKKGKYWPWIIIGSIGLAVCWIIVFALPVFLKNPRAWAIPVAAIVIVQHLLAGPNANVGHTLYARIAKDGKLRSYLAMWGKIGRDGMKVVVGFLFPLMLTGFLALGMAEVNAWAIIAVILAGASIALQSVTVILTKNSKVEKEALAGHAAAKSQRRPISKTFKAIFSNRALLGAFIAQALSKIFFFYHIMGGMFLWRYYMQNMGLLAAFMTLISLAAITGASCVPIVYKKLKDTKRCAVMAFSAQIVIYGMAYFIMSPENPWGTIFIICAAQFFNGMSDSFLQPLFAHGADYSVWKSGNKDYGLNMSVFGLSIATGVLITTISRTAILARGGFDSEALTPAAMAAGAVVPQGVITALHNLNTLYPFILCVVITLVIIFIYPLNDKKVEDIQKEIAARDAAAAKT